MLRLVLFLVGVMITAAGLNWLADRPGTLALEWQGYVLETSVFRAIVMLALLVATSVVVWNILRGIWKSPAKVGHIMHRRRERKGLDAISSGMIAIGSGDRALATRAAIQAKKSLPNEPLTHLLRAQTAQLQGDNATARRMFEAMLATPDTEQLGLRGLFLEASREGETEAARQYAERALRLRPSLEWPVDALFDMQCRARDIDGALETLAAAKKHGHIDRKIADRRRAVLLAGKAQAMEDDNAEQALNCALEAHNLAPELVPAAVVAGRILASRGQTPKAAKVLQKTWRLSPHPDIARVYAHARTGDSTSDRLERVRQLARLDPNSNEGALALAETALEARDWKTARDAMTPLLRPERMTQRVATLMAKLEGGEHGDSGRVREWLARAVNAPRDPAWTADGMVSANWAPFSPSGRLDAFEWKVPLAEIEDFDRDAITARTESLVALGAPRAKSSDIVASAKSSDIVAVATPQGDVAAKAAQSGAVAVAAAVAAGAAGTIATHHHTAPAAEWHSDAPATGESESLARIAEGELEVDDGLDQTAADAAHPASSPIRDDVEDAVELPITEPVRAAATHTAPSASTNAPPPSDPAPRPEPVRAVATVTSEADEDAVPQPARRTA